MFLDTRLTEDMFLAGLVLLVAHHVVENGVQVTLGDKLELSLGDVEGALLLHRICWIEDLPAQCTGAIPKPLGACVDLLLAQLDFPRLQHRL